MSYEYASIPTRYRDTEFRSRLEARWAAFADLAGWKWKYEPVDLNGWIPDFWFGIPCGHSECCLEPVMCCPRCLSPDREEITVERALHPGPFTEPGETFTQTIGFRCRACQSNYPHVRRNHDFHHELYAEVKPYRSLSEFDGHPVTRIDEWDVPSPAKFGWHPEVSEWSMTHGAGGGIYNAADWVGSERAVNELWEEAGNLTRWKGPYRHDD
jgi:hypothetical protein